MKYFTKREDRINVLLTILLLIILIANSIQIYNYKADERFEWSSGVLSQKGNVIQVRTCYFYHSGYWNYDVDKNLVIDDGWDEINSSEKSKENSFYPDSLSITWFSYTEKKFYNGNFKLPYSTILEKAKELRTTTSQYEESFAKENPDQISLVFLAEVLPKGKIRIWISDGDKKFKIGQYSAKPINETWHIFDDIEEKDINSKIDIDEKAALVMEKHRYNIELNLPDGFDLKTAEVELFNQNNWSLENSNNQKAFVFDHIPSGMSLSWGNHEQNFASQISFNELETLNTFRKLDVSGNSKPILLELTVNNKNDSIHIILKNEQNRVKIVPSYIDVYTLAK
ncbi:hypothetical protein L1276_001737 [Flavobacterium sp. HSC-32F16]|uniref:DUF2931 family protein n=1 Tax=Flavobacterium sp. HSC-32F16 TaxID=2910964 RepID=UPI0020A52588|nr:DUF2931 family protein [Flavobacterium sp. HSC-32F16]MCP2026593.1 hypothetical protein [Flavobacterium sp. HSC-32F16]